MHFFARLFCLTTFALSCYGFSNRDAPLIKTIAGPGTHFEGPHWSPTEEVLYWVDIVESTVYRYDPASGNVTNTNIGFGPITPVVSVKDNPGLVLICIQTELYFLHWDSSLLRLLSAIDLGLPDNRCNDGKVDPKGRLWIGTMGKEVDGNVDLDQGSLYMMSQENQIHPEVKVRPVSVSNGLTWSSNQKYMFYIDTPTRNVDVFDYDIDTGMIRNRRTLFSFEANNVTGLPDGMTIDSDGNLWIACYNGGKVIKVNSVSGKLLEQHNIPASKVTSVMFGGIDLDILFVTTDRRGLTSAELAEQPGAGSLFSIEGTGARGLPENQYSHENAANY